VYSSVIRTLLWPAIFDASMLDPPTPCRHVILARRKECGPRPGKCQPSATAVHVKENPASGTLLPLCGDLKRSGLRENCMGKPSRLIRDGENPFFPTSLLANFLALNFLKSQRAPGETCNVSGTQSISRKRRGTFFVPDFHPPVRMIRSVYEDITGGQGHDDFGVQSPGPRSLRLRPHPASVAVTTSFLHPILEEQRSIAIRTNIPPRSARRGSLRSRQRPSGSDDLGKTPRLAHWL
jgi:hypothetical protein